MANNLCIYRRYGLMGEIDYTMQVEIDNLLQLGVVGASDCLRSFMGVVYDINRSENAAGASRAMHFFIQIVEGAGGLSKKVLKDGAIALSSAAQKLSLVEADCLTHKCRLKSWNKKSNGGTRGSLENFLQKHGCVEQEIDTLTYILLAIDTLPSVNEYKSAILLMERYWYTEKMSFIKNSHILNHLKRVYFTEEPRIGCVHEPCEPHSTNGLEGSWLHRKDTIDIYRDLLKRSGVEAILLSIGKKAELSVGNHDFIWEPVQTIDDWKEVRDTRNKVPGQLRHVSCYVNGYLCNPSTLVHTCKNRVPKVVRKIVIYIPSCHLLSKLYKEAADSIEKMLNPGQATNIHKERKKDTRGDSNDMALAVEVQNLVWVHTAAEVQCPLGGENVVAYLKRRGQRMAKRKGVIHQSPRKNNIKKRIEKDNEIDKWDMVGNGTARSKNNKSSVQIQSSGKKMNHQVMIPLRNEPLGNFCRLVMKKNIEKTTCLHDCGYKVTCTCAEFRRKGTCMEEKFYRLIILNYYPPKGCMPIAFEGMQKERQLVIDNYHKICEVIHQSMDIGSHAAESTLPIKDPWEG